MIKIYTGTPGSGKSLHTMRLVIDYLKAGKNVIANFPIIQEKLKPAERKGKFYYVENEDITVRFLYQFKAKYHTENAENQTVLIIDEASIKFNCRESNRKDRLEFCTFFAQHRKFGYSVVLVAQNMRQIDRQIRDLIEIEIIHRKMNNISMFRILPFSLFIAVEKNVSVKQKNEHEMFLYNKRLGSLYDTFYDFKLNDNEEIEVNDEFDRQINKSEIQLSKEKAPRWLKGVGGPHTQRGKLFHSLIDKLINKFDVQEESDELDVDDLFFEEINEELKNDNRNIHDDNEIPVSNPVNRIFFNY
jgi:hypothetical protein